jgi:tRNA(Arg) A34 adenosine deaminase TadA
MSDATVTSFSVQLPAWVDDELAAVRNGLATDEDRMRLVNRLAERNVEEGTGGPFAALVVGTRTGEVVAAGVNLVLASGLSGSHAEVVTIGIAQARLGTWDLGAHDEPLELVVNWRPCAMCYGATLWSGVRSLTIAGDGPELEALTGFDEGPLREDWAQQLEARGIAVRIGVLRDEAVAVFERYSQRPGTTVYNARRG